MTNDMVILMRRLLAKTRAGETIWNDDNGKRNSFSIDLGVAKVIIARYWNEDYGRSELFLDLVSLDNADIERFWMETEADEGFAEGDELWNLARNNALKIDHTLTALFRVLESPGVVGKKRETYEDDIPW